MFVLADTNIVRVDITFIILNYSPKRYGGVDHSSCAM